MDENKKTGVSTGVVLTALTFFVIGAFAMSSVSLGMKATDEAVFCASCHVMSEAAWTHSQSVHAKLACNECHAPYDIVPKLPFKVAAGSRDIYDNFFSRVADVIHATPQTKDVVQENCRRCHTMTTSTVAMDAKPYCTDCHRAVPHNSKSPVASRRASDV